MLGGAGGGVGSGAGVGAGAAGAGDGAGATGGGGVTTRASGAGAADGPALSASFNPFPGLNFATVTEGICMGSFGFCGFTPMRPLRVLAIKAPKPAMFNSPPFWRVSVTMRTNSSTTSSACFLLMLQVSERWRMSSALFITRMVTKTVYLFCYFGSIEGVKRWYVCEPVHLCTCHDTFHIPTDSLGPLWLLSAFRRRSSLVVTFREVETTVEDRLMVPSTYGQILLCLSFCM